MSRANAWWVCASRTREDRNWDWRWYFDNLKRPHVGRNWGGPAWIRSKTSHARIKEMKRGDAVVAYQAGVGVVGFTGLAKAGHRARGSDAYDVFDLRPAGSIGLNTPVPLASISALPEARSTFEFVRAKQGTVFRVEPGGFEQVVALALAFNPELRSRLLKLL